MEHLPHEVLVQKLRSHDLGQRRLAAEELGARGSREALGPLLRALGEIDSGYCEAISTAVPIIDALGDIGDPVAIGPILYALEVTAGVMFTPLVLPTPTESCGKALVKLGAISALPALEKLQRSSRAQVLGHPLANVIIDLGGPAVAPLFEELLQARWTSVQAVSAVALGRLRHQGALPKLRALSDHHDLELRTAALAARIALGDAAAVTSFQEEMLRAENVQAKHNLLVLFSEAKLTSHADWLFQRCFEPAWASPRRMLFDTLSTAVQLGSAAALAHVRSLHQDVSLSLCDRASAAANLIDRDDVPALSFCLHFLQQREEQQLDPIDSSARWAEVQRDVHTSVRMFGQRHREHRLAIVDALTPTLRRGPSEEFDFETLFCPYECAGEVVYALTGACEMKSLLKWRAAHVAPSAPSTSAIERRPTG